MHRVGYLCFALLLMILGGCGDSNTKIDTGVTEELANDPFETQSETRSKNLFVSEDENEEIDRSRTSFDGLWKIVMYVPEGRNTSKLIQDTVIILEIKKDESGEYTANIINDDPSVDAPEVKLEIDDNHITMLMRIAKPNSKANEKDNKISLNIDGVLSNGIVLGNFVGAQRQLFLLSMLPTDSRVMTQTGPKPVRRFDEFIQAAQAKDVEVQLARFAAENPENPYAHVAYSTILRLSTVKDFDEKFLDEQLQKFTAFSATYGPRLESQTREMLHTALISSHRYPELALRYYDEYYNSLPKEQQEKTAELRTVVHDVIAADKAMLDLSGDQKAEAVKTLKGLLEKTPYESRIMYAVAEYDKENDNIDEALKLLGTIATLPTLEENLLQIWGQINVRKDPPSKTFEELWVSRHGDQSGIAEYQKNLYQEFLNKYSLERVESEAVDGNRRKILCEYFTGTSCYPCIAPTTTLNSVSEAYSNDEFITLMYHAHAPAPDPLTNSDTQKRFERYGKKFFQGRPPGVPLTTLNGQIVPFTRAQPGGFLMHIDSWQKQFVEEFQKNRNQKSQIKINLSAKAEDGKLALSADVTGVVAPADNLRLRMAVAENVVDFVSRNKLRQHHMVVRVMPGGVDGVKPEEETFKYENSIELVDFKQELQDYLDAFEQQADFKFAAKPMKMKELSFVGFVQNVETNEILQAEIVPVTGELNYGYLEESEPAVSAEARSDDSTKQEDAEAAKPKAKPENEQAESQTEKTEPAPAAEPQETETEKAEETVDSPEPTDDTPETTEKTE